MGHSVKYNFILFFIFGVMATPGPPSSASTLNETNIFNVGTCTLQFPHYLHPHTCPGGSYMPNQMHKLGGANY